MDAACRNDIAAHRRIGGIAALRKCFAALRMMAQPHRYEVVDLKVRIHGDIGILTFRYEPRSTDGTALTRWKASSAYRRIAGEWRNVHAHWSMVKESAP
jgi:ketosteroid isomerase-like protein